MEDDLVEQPSPEEFVRFVRLYNPVCQVQEGLRAGLCKYSGPCRVSLLLGVGHLDDLLVFDPQRLLREHAAALKGHYVESQTWRSTADLMNMPRQSMAINVGDVGIPGLISFGARTGMIAYQMWFTDEPQFSCSRMPTERWLQNAAWSLSHDIALGGNLYSESSKFAMQGFALEAIQHHLAATIHDATKKDTSLRVRQILDAILALSNALEEGRRCSGKILFCQSDWLRDMNMPVVFDKDSAPAFDHPKHVRKLLQTVEGTDRYLLSDEQKILGILEGPVPALAISASFQEGRGDLTIGDELVCTFSDGRYSSLRRGADLTCLDEALKKCGVVIPQQTLLIESVKRFIGAALRERHGCTLLIDLRENPEEIGGYKLATPLSISSEKNQIMAANLAKLDGALHFSKDCNLLAFSCLLDGRRSKAEDRSRGARYNSALRFTETYPATIALVVSEDGPISIFCNGEQLNKGKSWPPITSMEINPPTLTKWLSSIV